MVGKNSQAIEAIAKLVVPARSDGFQPSRFANTRKERWLSAVAFRNTRKERWLLAVAFR